MITPGEAPVDSPEVVLLEHLLGRHESSLSRSVVEGVVRVAQGRAQRCRWRRRRRDARGLRRLGAVLEVARRGLERAQVALEAADHDDERERRDDGDADEGDERREQDLAPATVAARVDFVARDSAARGSRR